MSKVSKRDQKELAEVFCYSLTVHYASENYNLPGHRPRVIQVVRAVSFIVKECKSFVFNGDEHDGEILSAFYSYLRKYSDHTVVHWNMNSHKFGFPHLGSFGRSLKTPVYQIPDAKVFDLKAFIERTFVKANKHETAMLALFHSNNLNCSAIIEGSLEANWPPEALTELMDSTLQKTKNFLLLAERLTRNQFQINRKPENHSPIFTSWVKGGLFTILMAIPHLPIKMQWSEVATSLWKFAEPKLSSYLNERSQSKK